MPKKLLFVLPFLLVACVSVDTATKANQTKSDTTKTSPTATQEKSVEAKPENSAETKSTPTQPDKAEAKAKAATGNNAGNATQDRPKVIPLPQFINHSLRDHWKVSSFREIAGWENDEQREVWPAFLSSCQALRFRKEWNTVCEAAKKLDASNTQQVRSFFEVFFRPYKVLNEQGGDDGLITGYFEPVVRGVRQKRAPYLYPLYRTPPDLIAFTSNETVPESLRATVNELQLRGRVFGQRIVPYYTRLEIMQRDLLEDSAIVWLDDPMDAYLIELQGSGQVQLMDENRRIRLGFTNHNGHPFRSVARYLIDKKVFREGQASNDNIRRWLNANPTERETVLGQNPRVIFFEEKNIATNLGPVGAMGISLNEKRSIAVDPLSILLGAPVFLSTSYPQTKAPMQRLVMAQDVGTKIRGKVRADFFWGTGTEAEELAQKMSNIGQMWILLPRDAPYITGSDIPQ